jgi:hypothetical protein
MAQIDLFLLDTEQSIQCLNKISLFLKSRTIMYDCRGEVNAADAFDIGSFDEEDTKGKHISE